MVMSGGQRALSSHVLMRVGLGCIVLLLVLALGAAMALIEFKTGVRAYVTGESLWSKGRQAAVYHLNRYTETADPEHLRQAREGLVTPLAYRKARQAMTANPMEAQRATANFRQAGSHADDIPRLISVYRYMGYSSLFHSPMQIWRDADPHILRLEEILDLLSEDEFDRVDFPNLREEIDRLNQKLVAMESNFSSDLGRIDRTLNGLLLLTVITVLALGGVLVTMLFVSAARRMARTEDELRTTLEQAAVGMARLSLSGVIRSANQRFAQTLGYPRDGLEGMQLDQLLLLNEGDTALDMPSLRHKVERNGTWTLTRDEPWTREDGTPLWLEFTFSAVHDHRGRIADYIVVVDDISHHRSQVEKLSYEASHDELTGAINRREFLNRLAICLENSHYERSRHALCFVDLDYFKEINDTHGHQAGDDCLVQLCRIIRSQLREGDILARLGGDEFALIFTYCPVDVAKRLAEELRQRIADHPFSSGSATFRLSASIGVTEVRSHHRDPESVMEAADQACYGAKEHGRNHVYVVSLKEPGVGSTPSGP
ncbi:GGDEF domain-containing protein [Vreelandella utahensis]|uniref:GGDEF domain-containing protein n=1 Tax=Vreelandella halophila TaxID=86177 RepID=UPI000984A9A0|nr:sensor domain-containing diguanylate cyclase [Halomonas utahensis]